MAALRADVRSIAAATGAKEKYAALVSRIDAYPENPAVELVYLAPCRVPVRHPLARALTFADLAGLTNAAYPEAWELFRAIVLPALI